MTLLDILEAPKKVSEAELLEGWGLLVKAWENVKKGTSGEFGSPEAVVEAGVPLVQEIIARNQHTFKEKGSGLDLLRSVLSQYVQEGPFVEADHAEALYRGKETALAKREEFDQLLSPGIMFSPKLAWGFSRFGAPDQVDVEEFDSRIKDHGVTPGEREARFGKARKLWIYPVREIVGFVDPRKVKFPEGDKVYVPDATFLESSLIPKDWDLRKLSSADLYRLHAQLHESAVEGIQETGESPGGNLVNRHAIVFEEFRRRELEHRESTTELDVMTKNLLSWDVKENRKRITLSEVYDQVQGEITLTSPVLSIIGDAAAKGWGEQLGLQVSVPAAERRLLQAIVLRVMESVPADWRNRLAFSAGGIAGDHKSIPFADLVLRIRKPEERISPKLEESIPVNLGREAEKSRQEDSVVPGRFYRRLQAKESGGGERALAWAQEASAK